jgi:hypothetical protein
MDTCFNKAAADEQEVKAEVRKALKMFEHARGRSPLVGRFLDALQGVMKRHRVLLSEANIMHGNAVLGAANHAQNGDTTGLSDAYTLDSSFLLDGDNFDDAIDADLDSFWKFVMQSEPTLDAASWDELFASLSQRPV